MGEEEEEEIVENYIIEEIDEEELEAMQSNKSQENQTLVEEYQEEIEDPEEELELEEQTEDTNDDDGDIEIVIEEDLLAAASSKFMATVVTLPPHTKKCSNHVPIPVSMAEMGDPEDKEFMAQFISLQTSCPAPGRHVCNLCHKEYKLVHSLHNHMKSHSNWIKVGGGGGGRNIKLTDMIYRFPYFTSRRIASDSPSATFATRSSRDPAC